jgi:hypothetical protein
MGNKFLSLTSFFARQTEKQLQRLSEHEWVAPTQPCAEQIGDSQPRTAKQLDWRQFRPTFR